MLFDSKNDLTRVLLVFDCTKITPRLQYFFMESYNFEILFLKVIFNLEPFQLLIKVLSKLYTILYSLTLCRFLHDILIKIEICMWYSIFTKTFLYKKEKKI